MKIICAILIFIFLCTNHSFCQAYCTFDFYYKGTIRCDSVKLSRIGIPGTKDLEKYDGIDSLIFTWYHLPGKKFMLKNYGFGCNYCNPQVVFNSIIKKNREFFPVKIFTKTTRRPRIIFIPFSQIRFTPTQGKSKYSCVVDLGDIRL